MAKNVSEAISEEEEWEAEEADAQKEQGFEKEYSDDGGENTAASASGPHAASLEFVCARCGAKKGVRSLTARRPVHCAKPMQLVDHDSKMAMLGVGRRRAAAVGSRNASGRASSKGKPAASRRTPARGRASKGKRPAASSRARGRSAAKGYQKSSSVKKRPPASRKSGR